MTFRLHICKLEVLLMPQNETAVLRVLVTTALGAFPLEGASVTVSTPANAAGERTLLYAVRTDQGGLTPPMALPTPPRADSMTPNGSGQPFSVYTVEITREGYTPQSTLNVAMFSGVPAVLPVALTPLPENAPNAQSDFHAPDGPQALYLGPNAGEE